MNTDSIRTISTLLTSRYTKQKLQSNYGYLFLSRIGIAAFFVLSLCCTQPILAQEMQVTGTVTDSLDGAPLPGVNVVVKGMPTRGTSTDGEGQYKLTVPSEQDTLLFTFIGFIAKEVPVQGRSTVDVTMTSDIQQLEDVVVVGYGTQSKRDATGSVLAVTEKDFNGGVIASPEQLLQGRAAGVQITPASGEPGAGVTVRIRGTSSVRSGNDPLFVVDGVPLNVGNADIRSQDEEDADNYGINDQSARNPLSFLNPDDIESISVLKDASAAAIYGSRASNGVVLITTKQGSGGPGEMITVRASTSVSTIREKLDLLEPGEYVDAAAAAGADPNVVNFGGSTDWQDEIFRNAVSQDYSIGYGGGNETTTYRISLGYSDQEGIIENSSLERLSAHINANHKILDDKVQLNLNLISSRLNDTYAPISRNAGFEGDLIGAALQANPTRSPFDEDGNYAQASDWRNPAAMLGYIDDKGESTRTLANLAATYNITDWLSYKLNLAYDNTESVQRTGINPDLNFTETLGKGRALIDNRYLRSTLVENTLNFRRDILEQTTLELLGGFSYQEFENRGDFLQSEFFVTNDIPFVDNVDGVNNVDNKAFSARSDRSIEELQSFFGRANINYDNRYLATINFRADGSTKFGENNKYGYFPSAALAWRVTEEDFFNNMNIGSVLSDLKVRAGWGITGNQEFPGGASLAIFRTNNDGSLTQVNNPNPDIQWEETEQWNIGLDFELFDGRINGVIDYFDKSTTNLIFRQDFAQPAAVDYQWVNLDGTVKNTGLEVALDGFVTNRQQFSWQVMYNMSFLNNEVERLATSVNTGEIHGQGLSGAYAQRIAEGEPLYAYYMREFTGYDENGLAQYADNEALKFVGDPLPDFTLGLTNNLSYGRFDLSAFLTGSFGFKVYNNTANAIFLKGNLRNGRNITQGVANSEENAANFGEVSTRFLEDGDFIRLANLTIGYNVNVVSLDPIRRLRLTLTGQNLFVITDYTGFDPEVNIDKNRNDVPSFGIDYTAYPRARTVTFGVQFDI